MTVMKVGLAGLGTVGGGTWNVCKKNSQEILAFTSVHQNLLETL